MQKVTKILSPKSLCILKYFSIKLSSIAKFLHCGGIKKPFALIFDCLFYNILLIFKNGS